MPQNLGQPDSEVPDYVPKEWLTRYGSATKPWPFTMPKPLDVALVGLLLFVGFGVFSVTIASAVWPAPSGWRLVAVLISLAVLAGACWLAERLLARSECEDQASEHYDGAS